MDGGAWWAAVHEVAQSRTRLKRLSSSSGLKIPISHLETNRLVKKHFINNYTLYPLIEPQKEKKQLQEKQVSLKV